MSIHHTRLRLVAVGLSALSQLACGDDAGSKKDDTDGGLDGGLVRIDGGGMTVDGAVPGEEGYPCSVNSECDAGLDCIPHTLPGSSGLFGFCGKTCASHAECPVDSVCTSDTGGPEGLNCSELVHEEFGTCGPAAAAVCDGRTCLLQPPLPLGVCVDLCTLNAGSEDAGVEDGGVDDAVACRAELTCLDVLGDPNVGMCGEVVARGEVCALEQGTFCAEEDVCAPADVNDLTSEGRCQQSCADQSVTCAEGSCRILNGRAFCQ